MASNADFVQYIVDQCSGAGEVTAKKMMGDIASIATASSEALFAITTCISSPRIKVQRS